MIKLLPLLSFLFLLTVASCKKPVTFQYRDIKNVRIQSLGRNTKVAMDLVFYNPNNYGVNLKSVDCDLFVDSSHMGKFILDTLMHIPSSSEFTIPANLQVDLRGLLKNSISLIFNNEVVVGAKGTTRVGRGGFFVTVPFNYQGKQKINLF